MVLLLLDNGATMTVTVYCMLYAVCPSVKQVLRIVKGADRMCKRTAMTASYTESVTPATTTTTTQNQPCRAYPRLSMRIVVHSS
jgi:hypothetical protein